MSNYKRTAAARRNKPRKAGRLLSFAVLLSLVAVFTITANAIASSPTTVASNGSGREGTYTTHQPDSVNLSEQQPELAIPPVHNESEDWMLTLVNADNPLPDDHAPALKSLTNGLKFDERAIDQLNAMLSDMRAQGLSPVVCSAYRSIENQRTLFNNKINNLISSGLSREQADIEARSHIAYPGTSEHNLGLAADIVSLGYQHLDDAQADTPEVKWLMEHCYEYGFILRYPEDKTDITGIIYEPWHYRYVGKEAAAEMAESGLCLEEYLAG